MSIRIPKITFRMGNGLIFMSVVFIALSAVNADWPSQQINGSIDSICPGLYCGRTVLQDGNTSDCGACARGSRPNEFSICKPCDGEPSFYDWLYLGFHVIAAMVLHWFFIDFTNKKKDKKLIILHASAAVESLFSCVITVLIVEPIGEWRINSCGVQKLSDWYTMLYNPSPDYIHTIHCTQEIVYPLYTMVMIYYAICLVLMLIVRPVLSWKVANNLGTKSIYAAMYFFPILTVVQAIFGGLLYYAFPHITIVVSVATCALHFAYMDFQKQNTKDLIKEAFTKPRQCVIVFGHWILHAYGIYAITELQNMWLVCFVVVPSFFYIVTVKFTHPDHLNHV
ncbi:JNK1/MAPK8-associated membrane protein-like [Tubulanus polymorphus]|uniref:JNK1/MAPK8-associated membrane protein-like n=1 Tax=Tubulanus polymorphus TaxID=672921 RepID=UPI003DA49961